MKENCHLGWEKGGTAKVAKMQPTMGSLRIKNGSNQRKHSNF